MSFKVWNSQVNTIEQALDLPKGSYAADFGFLVQQSVDPNHVLEAAQAVKDSGEPITVATQAKLMVVAQEKGLAFTTWAGRLVSI